MKPLRAGDARRLDVSAAAAAGARLQGSEPVSSFERLAAAPSDGDAGWSAVFGRRAVAGGAAQPELHLEVRAQITRECQRCLQPLPLALQVDRHFRFAPDEATAAALDADSDDDDVLALSPRFDLLALIEDELLLALPLVPKHDACLPALAAAAGAAAVADERAQHPFAALAALKGDRGGDRGL